MSLSSPDSLKPSSFETGSCPRREVRQSPVPFWRRSAVPVTRHFRHTPNRLVIIVFHIRKLFSSIFAAYVTGFRLISPDAAMSSMSSCEPLKLRAGLPLFICPSSSWNNSASCRNFLSPPFPAFCLVNTSLHHLHVGKDKFQIDDLDIAQRISSAFHMHHIRGVKTPDHMDDSVGHTDIAKKFVAETFPWTHPEPSPRCQQILSQPACIFGEYISLRKSNRSSGTVTTPTFGSIVQG